MDLSYFPSSSGVEESSSFGRISICGSLRTALLAILLSREISSEGKQDQDWPASQRAGWQTPAHPKATVPPKFEITNTEKPKNKHNRSVEHTHPGLPQSCVDRLLYPPFDWRSAPAGIWPKSVSCRLLKFRRRY